MPETLISLQSAGASPPVFSQFFLIAAMIAIFYFLVWRPQRQETQEQAKLVAGLQKGDRVVTQAGIHGKIHEARADTLVIEVAPNSFLTIERDAVRKKLSDEATAAKG